MLKKNSVLKISFDILSSLVSLSNDLICLVIYNKLCRVKGCVVIYKFAIFFFIITKYPFYFKRLQIFRSIQLFQRKLRGLSSRVLFAILLNIEIKEKKEKKKYICRLVRS